jgi:hypothetical protein
MSKFPNKDTQFKKGNPGGGRPVGTKNRSTLLKKWIEVHAKVKNPITKELEQGTVEDLITIALIDKALSGDIQAIKEVNDTLYGKLQENQKIEGIPKSINILVDNSETAETLRKLRDGTEAH